MPKRAEFPKRVQTLSRHLVDVAVALVVALRPIGRFLNPSLSLAGTSDLGTSRSAQ
jgi:hypothetical protein